jgi:hypothetical protein
MNYTTAKLVLGCVFHYKNTAVKVKVILRPTVSLSGLLAIITLEDLFRAYAPFQHFCHFLKCILEVMFCEGILHRLRFGLDHLICVKMASFQFHIQSGKQRKVRWVGNDSHVVFGNKFRGEGGS